MKTIVIIYLFCGMFYGIFQLFIHRILLDKQSRHQPIEWRNYHHEHRKQCGTAAGVPRGCGKDEGFQRITALFDEGTFNEVDSFAKSGDGSAEVVAGYGEVDGCPAYAFVQNSDVDGGAMSKAQAAKIKKIYDLAVKTGSAGCGDLRFHRRPLEPRGGYAGRYGEDPFGKQQPLRCCAADFLVLGPCLGTLR